MRELNSKEIEVVSGGMKWRGRRQSHNVEDVSGRYVRTSRSFGVMLPDPKRHHEITGTLLSVSERSVGHFTYNQGLKRLQQYKR